jgi:hypothetical protein
MGFANRACADGLSDQRIRALSIFLATYAVWNMSGGLRELEVIRLDMSALLKNIRTLRQTPQ